MDYLIGAAIAIFIYSFILTVITVYKDESSYFIVKTIDVVMAGPCAWIFIFLFNFVIAPVYRMFHKEDKNRPYKKKDSAYISKVVKKVVRNYSNKKNHEDYFRFDCISGYYGEYEGYSDLLVKKARNERLNNKFYRLMAHQKEETINELMKYFTRVTEDIMCEHNCCSWYIDQYKDKELYVLSSVL